MPVKVETKELKSFFLLKQNKPLKTLTYSQVKLF